MMYPFSAGDLRDSASVLYNYLEDWHVLLLLCKAPPNIQPLQLIAYRRPPCDSQLRWPDSRESIREFAESRYE